MTSGAATGIIIAIVLLCVFYFLLNIWDSYKLRKLRVKHEEEIKNDKREKGEPPSRVRSITASERPVAGTTVAHQRELLQATEAIPTGKTDVSDRKSSNLARRFIQNFRKEE